MTDQSIRPDYESQTIRITDLAVTRDVIAGKVFSNCQIVGPAMLALLDADTITNCTFDVANNDIDSIIFEIDGPRWLNGVIGLQGCAFYGCRFTRVGFVLDPAGAADFRRGAGS